MEGPLLKGRPFALGRRAMRDLFDTPLLPGLATADAFVTTDEERDLATAIDAALHLLERTGGRDWNVRN